MTWAFVRIGRSSPVPRSMTSDGPGAVGVARGPVGRDVRPGAEGVGFEPTMGFTP